MLALHPPPPSSTLKYRGQGVLSSHESHTVLKPTRPRNAFHITAERNAVDAGRRRHGTTGRWDLFYNPLLLFDWRQVCSRHGSCSGDISERPWEEAARKSDAHVNMSPGGLAAHARRANACSTATVEFYRTFRINDAKDLSPCVYI